MHLFIRRALENRRVFRREKDKKKEELRRVLALEV